MLAGRRGRKKEGVPKFVETRDADSKVRCKICLEHSPNSYRGDWIAWKNFKGHEQSNIHISSLKLKARKEKEENTAIPEIQENYASARNIDIHMQDPGSRQNCTFPAHNEEEVWDNFDGTFEIDDDPSGFLRKEREEFNRKVQEWGAWEGEEPMLDDEMETIQQHWEEADEEDLLSELLENIALQQEDSEVESETIDVDDGKWFPYPSKLVFLLDTIDNLPRQCISGSFLKVLLWFLRELGVKNVPSFDTLRKVQKSLREESGVPTIHWMSPKGNAFSFNDPRILVSNDWTNPLVCSHIRRYPVIPKDGVISEVWHAEKWRKDLDRNIMSPMFDAGDGQHYYINKPARLIGGQLVIPVRWLEDEGGNIWADAWAIKVDDLSKLSNVDAENVILVDGRKLESNLLGLEDAEMPQWSAEAKEKGYHLPNPDRELAQGYPLYTSFIDIFGDDVSGNRSKSWNKHWNIYMNHRNLPRQILHSQHHTHFVSTSTNATVPEQFQGIKEIIETTHQKPLRTRNAITGQETQLKIYCNCGPGDNPAQSETCGHIGSNGNFPCRKCHVGGTQIEKETDEGYHSLFTPGEARSAVETIECIEKQVHAACLGIAQKVKDLQTESGVKDAYTQYWIDSLIESARNIQKANPQHSVTEIQEELMKWVHEHKEAIYNPFLTMKGFDASRDTPVEILHTILLGVEKYLWHGSHTSWNTTQEKTYSIRLQATDASSLSIPPIHSNYIMQYANSLIGRQLKTLVQVNVFHVYDLVDELRFSLTKAVGELGALLWFPEIRNLKEYLSDIEIAVANVLDIAAAVDPSKIIAKIKYHLLAHIREDILRFGPMIGVATEIFESFNAIFRYCSILSNHLAPSRDIAYQLADQETLKHFLSGGWWISKNGTWHQPSPAVHNYMQGNSVLQTLIGWTKSENKISSGTIRLEPVKRTADKKRQARQGLTWEKTHAGKSINMPHLVEEPQALWYRGRSVISHSQHECKVGMWVYAKSPTSTNGPPVTGQILEILQESSMQRAFVVLDIFSVSATRHELFGMPVLSRRFGEKMILVAPANTILFDYNVQHDCRHAECTASGLRAIVQERTDSGKTEVFIQHKPVDRYLINTHAFHNAHLIRSILPRDLTVPIAFTADRRKHHHDLASGFRASQDAKRAATAVKNAEKRKAAAEKDAASKRHRRQDGLPYHDLRNAGPEIVMAE